MRILAGCRAGVLAGLVLAAGSLACSFSYSSESFSDSSESSSESSSSSSPESNSTKYREDVESYTQAYVISGGQQDTFFSGVSDLARKRGISDWESDHDTWRGIGKGLGRTKIDSVQLAVYEKNWASDDPAKVNLIRKGFAEVR
jgi:hypothetical protein